MNNLIKIWVANDKTKNPGLRPRCYKLMVWAAFAISSDAHDYAAKLREQHPTWVIVVKP